MQHIHALLFIALAKRQGLEACITTRAGRRRPRRSAAAAAPRGQLDSGRPAVECRARGPGPRPPSGRPGALPRTLPLAPGLPGETEGPTPLSPAGTSGSPGPPPRAPASPVAAPAHQIPLLIVQVGIKALQGLGLGSGLHLLHHRLVQIPRPAGRASALTLGRPPGPSPGLPCARRSPARSPLAAEGAMRGRNACGAAPWRYG